MGIAIGQPDNRGEMPTRRTANDREPVGEYPYMVSFEQRKRTAALMSWIRAGNSASGDRR